MSINERINEQIDEQETEAKNCDIHGEYLAKVNRILHKTFYTSCPDCSKIRDEKEIERKKLDFDKAEKAAKLRFLESTNIVSRYWNVKLEDITPTENQEKAYKSCLEFVKRFAEMCEKGQCLVFCGGVGTGKTLLASALIQSLGGGYYIRAIDISRSVRNAYSENKSEYEVIKNLSEKSLLVIDEIGVQMNSQAEALLITDLIDRRYGEMLPTILLSNLDREGICKALGERAFDRIMQNGALIPIIGESNR